MVTDVVASVHHASASRRRDDYGVTTAGEHFSCAGTSALTVHMGKRNGLPVSAAIVAGPGTRFKTVPGMLEPGAADGAALRVFLAPASSSLSLS